MRRRRLPLFVLLAGLLATMPLQAFGQAETAAPAAAAPADDAAIPAAPEPAPAAERPGLAWGLSAGYAADVGAETRSANGSAGLFVEIPLSARLAVFGKVDQAVNRDDDVALHPLGIMGLRVRLQNGSFIAAGLGPPLTAADPCAPNWRTQGEVGHSLGRASLALRVEGCRDGELGILRIAIGPSMTIPLGGR